jgi:hypothetical protein
MHFVIFLSLTDSLRSFQGSVGIELGPLAPGFTFGRCPNVLWETSEDFVQLTSTFVGIQVSLIQAKAQGSESLLLTL